MNENQREILYVIYCEKMKEEYKEMYLRLFKYVVVCCQKKKTPPPHKQHT